MRLFSQDKPRDGICQRPRLCRQAEKDLLTVAAENCFWNLNLSVLRRLCEFLAVDISKKAPLCKVCAALVDGIIDGCTDEQRLEYLKKRALGEEIISDDILDCADAGEVLGREDQKELKTTMQEQKRQKEDVEEFRSSYKAARTAHAKARAAAAGAPSSRSSSSGSGSRSALALRRAPESTVPQPTIQQYCPPKCHVWRDLGRGAWHSHLEGFRHFSGRWDHYRESGAAWVVLKHSWRLHL